MDIENFTYREFIQQDPELIQKYSNILFMMEGKPIKTDLEDLTLDQVEQIKQDIMDDTQTPKIIGFVEHITEEEFYDMRIVELYGKLITITEQLEEIVTKEQNYLSPEYPNTKWEMVEGSKHMERFGLLPMVDNLAKGDVTKWQEILDTKYSLVFTKLFMDTVKGDLEHKMMNIKTKANV